MRTVGTEETMNHLMHMMDTHERVYYTRYGDGDFRIMRGLNDRLHKPSERLGNEVRDGFLINHDEFIRGAMVNYPHEPGMTDGVFAPPADNSEIEVYLRSLGFDDDSVFFSHIAPLYYAVFRPNDFVSFLDKYIRPKRKMFIGGVYKEHAERLVGPIDHYIQIPRKDAYYSIDEWYTDVVDRVDDVELILPSGGMAGRVLQKRLWNLNIFNGHSIELGSIIDAAAGEVTRTWIARTNIKDILL